MPNRLTWYDDAKTIAIIEQNSEGSWAYWYEIVDLLLETVEESPHKVNFILTNTTSIPAGNPIPHFKRTMDILTPKEDRFGTVVIVGSGSIAALIKAFLSIVLKVANRSSHIARFATSVDEAVKIIEEYAEP